MKTLIALALLTSLATPAAVHALQQRDTTATIRWRLIARDLGRAEQQARTKAIQAANAGDSSAWRAFPPAPIPPARVAALASAAQYAAADSARLDSMRPPRSLTVASAAAAVLATVLPNYASKVEQELARDIARARAAGATRQQIAAARGIGGAIASSLIDWANKDGYNQRWEGAAPTGPGMWYSAPGQQPGAVAMIMRKPWVIDSIAQFRLPAPPAFDSPEFKAALNEVRTYARNRTPEQTRIARKWQEGGPNVWVDSTVELLMRQNVSDDVVLRLISVLAVGGYDLHSACWDTKFTYWLIRPSQADTTIALAQGMPLPNFPAYPSGHACFAGFASTVIGHFIPELRDDMKKRAEENAMSRLYAGVHYRFDNDAGLELGRRVAEHLIQEEAAGRLLRRWRASR